MKNDYISGLSKGYFDFYFVGLIIVSIVKVKWHMIFSLNSKGEEVEEFSSTNIAALSHPEFF